MINTPRYEILVISNDPATVRIITNYFECKGYSCGGADSGAQALKELARYTPKVILLDDILDYTTIELLSSIKSNLALKIIPIFILSKWKKKENETVGNDYFDADVVNFFKFTK